ncbi:Quercetin 2,3-dioxygenase [compost metagenome]
MYAGLLDADESVTLALDPARKTYVHLVRGALTVNGNALSTGDAVLIEKESTLSLTDGHDAEVLVFDLAA